MDISSLTITIPVAIALGSGIIGILTFFGKRRKQDKNEEARLVRMETMLVQIEKNTNSLNTRVDTLSFSLASQVPPKSRSRP